MTFEQIENAARDSFIEFVLDDIHWKWACAAGYNPVRQTGSIHVMRKDLLALREVHDSRPQSIEGIAWVGSPA